MSATQAQTQVQTQVQETTISLPKTVVESARKLAQQENRTVGELMQELIAERERAIAWRELRQYGRERALASGYKEEDVVRLVKEVRKEMAEERAGK